MLHVPSLLPSFFSLPVQLQLFVCTYIGAVFHAAGLILHTDMPEDRYSSSNLFCTCLQGN